ncbi:hypothetical protein ACHWQZ_G003332 [Mnemiopsis leidyi]
MAGTSRAGSLSRMTQSLRGERGGSFTVEREKELQEAFFKACSEVECPPKEKHVRTITISTWQERTAQTFWMMLQRLPYQSKPVVCWKLVTVIHKVIVNGHPTVIRESIKWVDLVEQMRRHWNYSDSGYPLLIALYAKLVRQKIILHRKWPVFPSNLDVQEKQWKLPENDINLYFQLAVDCFEYLDTMLKLVRAIRDGLSGTAQFSPLMIQCRLHPYICIVPESYNLYGIIVRIMQKLYTSLPPDTLEGHNSRFKELYRQLNRFYIDCQGMQYIDAMIGIPGLDDRPPDFARHAAYTPPPRPRDPEPATDELVRIEESSGREGTESPPPPDDRDELIQQLLREVCELRKKLTSALQNCKQHGSDIRELESARNLAIEQKRGLESQLANLQISPQVSEEQQQKLEEAEGRWRDSLERCEKLKQAYGNLRQEHINLIRAHAETKKSLESQEQLLTDITQQLESKNTGSSQQLRNLEIQVLKLESDKNEAQRKFETMQEELQTIQVHNIEVKQENSSLTSNVEQLRLQATEAGRLADKLRFDLDRAEKEKTNLVHKAEMQRADLNVKHEKEKQAIQRETLSKGEEECFLATVAHIKNHQNKNLYILNKAECAQSCSLEECTSIADNCHNIVKNVVMNQRWSVLRAADKISDLQQISQEFTQVAICVRAAMGSLASDKAELLHRHTEDVISSFVTALESLTIEDSLSGLVEGRTQQLCSALHDVAKLCASEESSMDNIVDMEMAATEAAINEAATKIQEIQNATRQRYTGLELEVGEKILGSCTELMACVRELILSSAALQREIVTSGQAGGTATDFYKRHSRWTEGLLSAAKAVGWGASTLVSTADDVVSGTGKFEQLEVTSHEIAASTAQLVAASRVKADKDSQNFIKVMGSSKSVANATATVVAASKQCMKLTEESKLVAVDYSQLSAVQVKRLDMEMQVKIKELENELTEERRRLTTMRKMHYHGDGTTNGGS